MKSMGKVKTEWLNTLKHYNFPHPQELEGLCRKYKDWVDTELRAEYLVEWNEECDKFNSLPWYSRLGKDKPQLEMSNFTKLNSFGNNLSLFFQSEYVTDDWEKFFFATQDLKQVLEVKAIYRRSDEVWADKNTLLSLERVMNDLDFYENMLDRVPEFK